MSEQRSADNEIAAGCALNETRAVRRATHAAVVPSMPDDNLLFAWGRGEDGQLGLGDTNDQTEPTYVDALRGVSVAQIACGSVRAMEETHCFVISNDATSYITHTFGCPLLFCTGSYGGLDNRRKRVHLGSR